MKTNEIVKRAQQIADLENSSFISWAENVQLLNEAYRDIYQKAINANIKFWLKEWILKDGENVEGNTTRYKLPNDFYTLYSINEKGTNRNLFRKSTNEAADGFKYDIENGYLVIYGAMRKDIVVKYYKTPQKLYYKDEDINSEVDKQSNFQALQGEYSDACDNRLVFFDSLTKKMTVYDIKTETTSDATLTINYDDIMLMLATVDGVMFFTNYNSEEHIILVNYDGTVNFDNTITDNPHYFVDEKKRLLCYGTDGNGRFAFSNVWNDFPFKYVKDIGYDFDYSTGAIVNYVDFTENKAYYIDRENDSQFFILSVADLETGEVERFDQLFSDYLGMFTVFDKWAYNGWATIPLVMGETSESEGAYCIGFNKKDYKTSYGMTDIDGIIHSIFENVEIDTPNSFFDSMLAYSLSLQYKAKQNAVNEGLVTLYQNAESQFFNSLPQDTFSNVRIQNVY